jgi:hypothetical protein
MKKCIYREGYYPDEEIEVLSIELWPDPKAVYFRLEARHLGGGWTDGERTWDRFVTEITYDAENDVTVFHCPENF